MKKLENVLYWVTKEWIERSIQCDKINNNNYKITHVYKTMNKIKQKSQTSRLGNNL